MGVTLCFSKTLVRKIKISHRKTSGSGYPLISFVFFINICLSDTTRILEKNKRITVTIPYALAEDSHFAKGNFSQFESINFFAEFYVFANLVIFSIISKNLWELCVYKRNRDIDFENNYPILICIILLKPRQFCLYLHSKFSKNGRLENRQRIRRYYL